MIGEQAPSGSLFCVVTAMKMLSRSEMRYAGLLLLLLVLAAVACYETLSYLEDRILTLDKQRAENRLSDYLTFEQDRMMAVLEHAMESRPPLDASQSPFLQKIIESGQIMQINLLAAAIVAPDGSLLDVVLSEGSRGRVDDGGQSLLDWKSFSEAVRDVRMTSAGYAGSALGPAFLSFSPIPTENGQALLLILRALDREYVRKIRQTYPDLEGMTINSEAAAPDQRIAIYDYSGVPVGYFTVSRESSLSGAVISSIGLPVYLLIMSFLFLSGGLGLWAIRFSTVIEGRRRVGRFVDAMDYLPDGVLLVDRATRAEGINPAAIEMSGGLARKGTALEVIFPFLSAEDVNTLMVTSGPHEVEKQFASAGGPHVWRFRSQPMEGMALIMISDVTSRRAKELRERQIATIHMIGRIARGVAHDFNNILCAVSGHAELLRALKPGREEMESVSAIIGESDRGARLAAHLLELSRMGDGGQPAEQVAEAVRQAGEILRVGLSYGWDIRVECGANAFPPVMLSRIQLEQVVVNLGLLVADDMGTEGVLHVMLRHPSEECLLKVSQSCAALVMVWASHVHAPVLEMDTILEEAPATQYGGVIHSVLRSMLEEVDGRLDTFQYGRRFLYRVCLPGAPAHVDPHKNGIPQSGEGNLYKPADDYLRGRKIMLASTSFANIADLHVLLMERGGEIRVAGSLVEALDIVNERNPLHLIVYDMGMLGEDARGLLRATLKLHPQAGILALCREEDDEVSALADRVEFSPHEASAPELLEALSSAWEKARRGIGSSMR
ncbi:MAG TPA: histidine kinase dimerization/phospho-acceptor domain-containing protein [Kiritimatiellia bacterium]|mgnify:CR=1 FL=1|nr:histidine kinase dimerization/phospho-acceptor domain-containing protein [Kiritimatiellia bacterium]